MFCKIILNAKSELCTVHAPTDGMPHSCRSTCNSVEMAKKCDKFSACRSLSGKLSTESENLQKKALHSPGASGKKKGII